MATIKTERDAATAAPGLHRAPAARCLYLRVTPAGGRAWVYRSQAGGRWQVATLGHHPRLTLAGAVAAAATRTAAPGTSQAASRLTWDTALTDFDAVLRARYRHGVTAKDTLAGVRLMLGPLVRRPIDATPKAALIDAVQARHQQAPNAAAKSLALLRQMVKWLLLREAIGRDPLLGVTPRALGWPAPQPRERVLSDDELRAVLAWGSGDGPALRAALRTLARIGEVLGFEPGQVAGDVWTIPITKNGKPHRLPMDPVTLSEFNAVAAARPVYVSMVQRMRAADATWNPHDLRRTGATWMAQAGVPGEVIEAVLNHAAPRLERTYRRPDMLPAMRTALAKWHVHLADLSAAVDASNPLSP